MHPVRALYAEEKNYAKRGGCQQSSANTEAKDCVSNGNLFSTEGKKVFSSVVQAMVTSEEQHAQLQNGEQESLSCSWCSFAD